MTQSQTTHVQTAPAAGPGTDSLASIRLAAQDLHDAISDAATQRGQEIKDRLRAIEPTAGALVASVRRVLGTQAEVAKQHLTEAVRNLETTEAQLGESLKASGQVFQNAVRQALADSRAAVQKISEVVAAARSARAIPRTKA